MIILEPGDAVPVGALFYTITNPDKDGRWRSSSFGL